VLEWLGSEPRVVPRLAYVGIASYGWSRATGGRKNVCLVHVSSFYSSIWVASAVAAVVGGAGLG
jgi:hypothetical protein